LGGDNARGAPGAAQPVSSVKPAAHPEASQSAPQDPAEFYQVQYPKTTSGLTWCTSAHTWYNGFYVNANAVSNPQQGTWLWVILPEDMSCYEGPAPSLDEKACIYIPANSETTEDPTGCLLTVEGEYSSCDDCEGDWE
jgi:hypothetical protein